MSDKAGIVKMYKQHFLLDEGKLRKVQDVLLAHGRKLAESAHVSFYVERENDSYYETGDVAEVLAEDNTSGTEVRLLVAHLYLDKVGADNGQSPELPDAKGSVAVVSFSRPKRDHVLFSVKEKDRDWCFLLADELDAQIGRLLQKRRLLDRFPREGIDPIAFCIGMGLLGLVTGILMLNGKGALTAEQVEAMTPDERTKEILRLVAARDYAAFWLPTANYGILGILVAAMIYNPIGRLVERLSRSCFYWGDVVAVHDAFERRMSRIKWVVAVGFIVSLVATLVGSLLTG